VQTVFFNKKNKLHNSKGFVYVHNSITTAPRWPRRARIGRWTLSCLYTSFQGRCWLSSPTSIHTGWPHTLSHTTL